MNYPPRTNHHPQFERKQTRSDHAKHARSYPTRISPADRPPAARSPYPRPTTPNSPPSNSPKPIPRRPRHQFSIHKIGRARAWTNDARTWEPLGITARRRRRRRRRRVRGTFAPPPPALMGWGEERVGGSTPPRARCGGGGGGGGTRIGEVGCFEDFFSAALASSPLIYLPPVCPRSNAARVLRLGPCTTPVSQNRAPSPRGFTRRPRTTPRVQRSICTRSCDFF